LAGPLTRRSESGPAGDIAWPTSWGGALPQHRLGRNEQHIAIESLTRAARTRYGSIVDDSLLHARRTAAGNGSRFLQRLGCCANAVKFRKHNNLLLTAGAAGTSFNGVVSPSRMPVRSAITPRD